MPRARGEYNWEENMSTELESSYKKKVFGLAMSGKWKEVVEMYKEDSMVQKANITRSGDTGLHIAVSDGKEEVVAQMLDSIRTLQPPHRKEALQTHNHRRNTALHLAAAMGNVKMCDMIASEEPSLVDCRNVDGETPLFLAALYGRKQAFLCLHYCRNPDTASPPYYPNCTRNCGDTILHCAIAGEYFSKFNYIYLYSLLWCSLILFTNY